MANVAVEPQKKSAEQQLERVQHEFDTLFVCFGEATDEIKLLKKRVRQLERHITKLSLQLHQ